MKRSLFPVLLLLLPVLDYTPTKPLYDFEKRAGFILPQADSCRSDGPGITIVHDGYTVNYDTLLKNPRWVAYPLVPEEISGETGREGSSFHPDERLPLSAQALPSDYISSGMDRGHQAPAGDFRFSRAMMNDTFSMVNMAPQKPEFNRGIWKKLEALFRGWAVRGGGLYVVTGPVLNTNLSTIGPGRVAVPEQFYKVALYCNRQTGTVRLIGFLLKNEGSNGALANFIVPVDSVERVTGLDFFPMLPGAWQADLKHRRGRITDWRF